MKLAWDTALDDAQRRVIDQAAQVAGQLDAEAFLVGGPVRDLMLGRRVFDLDFSVCGDSDAFAKELAARLDATLVVNQTFLTYRLDQRATRPVDVVTCRAETYSAGGALPIVRAASLLDDLARRDFTINTLAFDLRKREVVDPYGGTADLRARLVRVLHDKSFIDDPTRIFRALRLSARLGCKLEDRTETLLQEAIASGALATVSLQRLWRELELACDEESSSEAVALLASRGALVPLLGEADVSETTARDTLNRIPAMARIAGAEPLPVFVAALIRERRTFPGAPLRASAIERVNQASRRVERFLQRLTSTNSATRRIVLLERAAPELRALAAARSSEGEGALQMWAKYRQVSVDAAFARRTAARAGRRTAHFVRLFRMLAMTEGCEAAEVDRLAEAAVVRYLRSRNQTS